MQTVDEKARVTRGQSNPRHAKETALPLSITTPREFHYRWKIVRVWRVGRGLRQNSNGNTRGSTTSDSFDSGTKKIYINETSLDP